MFVVSWIIGNSLRKEPVHEGTLETRKTSLNFETEIEFFAMINWRSYYNLIGWLMIASRSDLIGWYNWLDSQTGQSDDGVHEGIQHVLLKKSNHHLTCETSILVRTSFFPRQNGSLYDQYFSWLDSRTSYAASIQYFCIHRLSWRNSSKVVTRALGQKYPIYLT